MEDEYWWLLFQLFVAGGGDGVGEGGAGCGGVRGRPLGFENGGGILRIGEREIRRIGERERRKAWEMGGVWGRVDRLERGRGERVRR